MTDYVVEEWTAEERAILDRHFTNTDRPVFALVNLPPVVAGALFARYSGSRKTLRRLFLDEFVESFESLAEGSTAVSLNMERAERLYRNVFDAFGDDSVAQLGGAHLAVEQCSNVMTKVIEWGRLAAYLEQSTRYVPFTDRPGGRFRYHTPDDVAASPVGPEYRETMDGIFELYCRWLPELVEHFAERFPHQEGD